MSFEDRDAVARRVIELLAQTSGREASTIRPEDPIGEFDSLDIVELVMLFEDEFGAGFDESEAKELKTVGDLIEWARRRLGS